MQKAAAGKLSKHSEEERDPEETLPEGTVPEGEGEDLPIYGLGELPADCREFHTVQHGLFAPPLAVQDRQGGQQEVAVQVWRLLKEFVR